MSTLPSDPATSGDEELARTLLIWLALSNAREQRRFLEVHPELLDWRSDGILDNCITQVAGQLKKTQLVRDAQYVLRLARERGGTREAIREAYVDLRGGLVLDIPPWLEEVENQLTDLQQIDRPEETAEARMKLLHGAIARMQELPDLAPEIPATLHIALAQALFNYLRTHHAQTLEEAITVCKPTLHVYTLDRYPHQYAGVQSTLGSLYLERLWGERRENLEVAIISLHEALRIFSPTAFPDDYATALYRLGLVYRHRIAGEREENLERAIVSMREVLSLWTLDANPVGYARVQNTLGVVYRNRIAGEQRENVEHAITCFHEALRVRTRDAFPYNYAVTQGNLGNAYYSRIAGERRENLERAIAHLDNALSICTRETFPRDYARHQNSLAGVYFIRIVGERRENLEQAIACLYKALDVWTREAFPMYYATTQLNLGDGYLLRLAGERQENVEQAITHLHEALSICTLESFPIYYAMIQNTLGDAYQKRLKGDRGENLTQALVYYQEALRVYTLDALPASHRLAQLNCARAEAQRENWAAVHQAYIHAREAEDLLVALGAGDVGRDAILKEGGDAALRDGYALTRLGRVEEAVVAVERGRARGLAEAIAFDAASPSLIGDTNRRERYTEAQKAFIAAQAALQTPLPSELDEDEQRRLDLQRTAAYRQAKAAFDALVAEIREAQDPADFLNAPLDVATILQAVERGGPGHTLVYLVATPWGSVALAAFSAHSDLNTSARLASLDLPRLTDDLVSSLVEVLLHESPDYVIGGFDCARRGNIFDLLGSWLGTTMREKARSIRDACLAAGTTGTIDTVLQEMVDSHDPKLMTLINQPLDALSEDDKGLLSGTLNHAVLQRELVRSQEQLAEVAMRPLVAWLREEGTTSLMLIPCGSLAAFPLTAIPLADGRTVGETFPTSIAPNARIMWRDRQAATQRAGVYAVGNPQPTHQDLEWGEAEALTLARLGKQLHMPNGVSIQWAATRPVLINALQQGQVVDASCHGMFDERDFLRSRLLLARDENLTVADMLSHDVDLRGLRLLILSACQTAILDLRGARDEVRSLAAGMLQAGASAVLAALWAVDDKATYLLIVRFAQEWLPNMDREPPAAALARAQQWLRTVTNAQLRAWQSTLPSTPAGNREPSSVGSARRIVVRGRGYRLNAKLAQEYVRAQAAVSDGPDATPYADPYFWAGFQIHGW